jgi:hypothetical protein
MVTVSPCLTNGGGLMATGMLQQRSDRRAESFVRETGAGPGVWLHANASTSGQWRGLLDGLATTFRALAPDAYAFRLPEWAWNHSGRTKEGTP